MRERRDRLLRNRSNKAAFLCYHSVASAGPRYLTISKELFEQQLATLDRRGIQSGDLQALARIAEGDQVGRTVFLTFDDGFRDNYETVLPMLRERGFTAFVFVLPPLVDTGAALDWPEVAQEVRRYPETMRSVTWNMLGAMEEEGFEVGSHTLSHAHLSRLQDEELREELWESRMRIKEQLGRCEVLAYPFGEWNDDVAAAASECGYRFAFSLPTGTGQRGVTELSIPRVNVDYRDGGTRFAAKLSPLGRRVLLSPVVRSFRRGRKAATTAGASPVPQ